MKRPTKTSSQVIANQLEVYRLVRTYCLNERADVPVGSPEMVRLWHRICRAVMANHKTRGGK